MTVLTDSSASLLNTISFRIFNKSRDAVGRTLMSLNSINKCSKIFCCIFHLTYLNSTWTYFQSQLLQEHQSTTRHHVYDLELHMSTD
ncbi:Highly reducing polyketide synthase azaB [Frankliniella fusca]|uniref:Highly reducing polyketide synthase azaB n=1 Tax=Frankliniella fusca TaxID=407009 RepID=A0AAE1HN97_9NEOP|nr:Highly reducing polyketide synthase azaB [Frankliniella fusca]